MELEEVKQEVLCCTKCNLSKTKTNYVFGNGSTTSKIMFIGEAPGANEDLQGEPFIGRAGQVFSELLIALNLKREEVYVCNILKCRPTDSEGNNRAPLPEEIEICSRYLDKQIDIIKPKIICPMGNFAINYILRKYGLGDKVQGVSKLHGRMITVKNLFDSVFIFPLYHPAVATYNPFMKEILLKDAELLKTMI